jgi:hypothetical protein
MSWPSISSLASGTSHPEPLIHLIRPRCAGRAVSPRVATAFCASTSCLTTRGTRIWLWVVPPRGQICSFGRRVTGTTTSKTSTSICFGGEYAMGRSGRRSFTAPKAHVGGTRAARLIVARVLVDPGACELPRAPDRGNRPSETSARELLRVPPDAVRLVSRLARDRSLPRGAHSTVAPLGIPHPADRSCPGLRVVARADSRGSRPGR